ncbi:uncharacterized protein LOC122376385 [Amphibalanus amphitrite]|uniref:uncharacterized protein LOC122376385 n=1 Tax=Amphibalanus amphitrite TaxID=1232801 RepID=UPI001C914595|nr:uncharacterized protein LOC122376385 [Amphibalanus amphitrite]
MGLWPTPPLLAALLGLCAALLPPALAVSAYDGLVQQSRPLNAVNFLLRDPPNDDWLTWKHPGDLPAADPSVTSDCECSARCLSDPGCFSYIYAPADGCRRLPSRGRATTGHTSLLSAGQLRFRDGMARLGDYCRSDGECTFVVEGSRCDSGRCVCQDGLYPLQGQCVTADQLTTTTASPAAGAGNSTADPVGQSTVSSTADPAASSTIVSSSTAEPPSSTSGTEPPSSTIISSTAEPSSTSSISSTAEPTSSTSISSTEPSSSTSTTEPTTSTTTLAATTPGLVSLVPGGVKDTNNAWSSSCPANQVVIGAMMLRTDGIQEFDNPSDMFCRGIFNLATSALTPFITTRKSIVDLNADGILRTCPNGYVVTALYAPGTSNQPFRLGALLCVNTGLSLGDGCSEEDPQVNEIEPGVNSHACLDGKVVTGAKIKQNFQGWIEKFNCCPLPAGLELRV